jgi:hypothetical protein
VKKLIVFVLVALGVAWIALHPQPLKDAYASLTGGPKGGGGETGGGCARADNTTGELLPHFDAADVSATLNPCLKFIETVSNVTDKIPDDEESKVGVFLGRLKEFTEKVQKVNDVTECAYEKDRLAIGVYQSTKLAWSVGVVAVVRGDIDAIAETSACYLIKQLSFLESPANGFAPHDQPYFCYEASRAKDNYLVMWLGSSDTMCDALNTRLTPGDGYLVGIRAQPSAVVRSAPSKSGDRLAAEPTHTLGRLLCFTDGDEVTNADGETSTRWGKIQINGLTGYVAEPLLYEWSDLVADPPIPTC